MYAILTTMVDRLDSGQFEDTRVLDWGCPIPFFGEVEHARIATVGINPSIREFADYDGTELTGLNRRFPTLTSLTTQQWGDVDASQVREIVNSCRRYFRHNPYDRWFRRLEQILTGMAASFYGMSTNPACHLDLVPYATSIKWGALPAAERRLLLSATCDEFGVLLRNTKIKTLVLNGRSVVTNFEQLIGRSLAAHRIEEWDLPRSRGKAVHGVAYTGSVESVGGIALDRAVMVVGYNHNLQSSFGVTTGLVRAIAAWIGNVSEVAKV